jgi:hypothetical protein
MLKSDIGWEPLSLVRIGDKNITLRVAYLIRSGFAPAALADYQEIGTFAKHSTERFAQQAPFNQ